MECQACRNVIARDSEGLRCTGCLLNYHYACVNMTTTYYIENTPHLKKVWLCPSCTNVTNRRNRNDNTPVRKPFLGLNETTMSVDDSIVNDSFKHDSSLNNELTTTSPDHPVMPIPDASTLLQHISILLDKKLEENKKSILKEIRDAVDIKIDQKTTILKNEINKVTDTLAGEQMTIKNQIKVLTDKIEKLELENNTLRQEIKQKIDLPTISRYQSADSMLKKFVLYGLDENEHETEAELHYRLVTIFHEFLNIDLTGYLEEFRRIGKKTQQRRPIVIEVLSKNVVKYVLKNSRHFRNTRLSLSEYLDESALQHRKHLQVQLRAARLDGRHAVIRNNKLVIDGTIAQTYVQNRLYSTSSKSSHNILSTTLNTTISKTPPHIVGASSQQNNTISDITSASDLSYNHNFRNNGAPQL